MNLDCNTDCKHVLESVALTKHACGHERSVLMRSMLQESMQLQASPSAPF